jgi:hypothetical protein
VPSFARDEERQAHAEALVRRLLQDAARLGIDVEDITRAFQAETGASIRE